MYRIFVVLIAILSCATLILAENGKRSKIFPLKSAKAAVTTEIFSLNPQKSSQKTSIEISVILLHTSIFYSEHGMRLQANRNGIKSHGNVNGPDTKEQHRPEAKTIDPEANEDPERDNERHRDFNQRGLTGLKNSFLTPIK